MYIIKTYLAKIYSTNTYTKKKAYKMNYATKQIYDNNAYRIKLDKTLSNETCVTNTYTRNNYPTKTSY